MRTPEPPTSDRPLALPPQVRVPTLADGCRNAALAFVRGAGRGWGKRELAAWLAGPYRTVTEPSAAHRRASERALAALARTELARAAGPVDAAVLDALLARTGRELRASLEGLRDPDLGVAFAAEALSAGHVHRCTDADGASGWCPVDPGRMTLRDRVASLLAADYLGRADDYARKLFVCADCGAVRFDAEAAALRLCPEHARPSRARVPSSRPSAPSH